MFSLFKCRYNYLINLKILIFILSSLVLITSCTTSPQTGTLSGTVQLQGETDHSGITLGIYELVTLDTTITRINNEYPHIGVIINQHTEFDHRFGNLVKYSETDASGHFNINDIPTGRYNLVAIKDSFGFKYIYEILINEGENALSEQCKMKNVRCKMKNNEKKSNSDNFTFLTLNFTLDSNDSTRNTADIILYPATHIHEDITETTIFESHHHYIITPEYGNYLEISGSLTIEPGAIIRLNENIKLTISGDLTAIGNEDSFIWFTSNDPSEIGSQAHISRGRFMTNPTFASDSLNYYNRVELTGSLNKQVSFCKFTQAGTGLLNEVNGFSISDCIFRNSSCGFKNESVDSTFCSNLLCENISNESEGGIYFTLVNIGVIKRNIFINNAIGLKVKDESNPEISNNYFCLNGFGAELFSSNSSFIHNELLKNSNDLRVCGPTSPGISHNNFESGIGIIVGHSGYYPSASPEIYYNNLNCNNYYYKVLFTSEHDINAQNNYYFTVNYEEINEKIYDKEDYEPSQQYRVGTVIFEPFLKNEVYNAGLEG